MIKKGAEPHAENGRDRRVEERRPVATELNTEATAGKSGCHSYLPIGVIPLFSLDLVQFCLVLIQRIIFYDGLPRQLADGSYGIHIDAMLLATLKFDKRMVVITEVHHEHCIVDKDMKILLG